MTRATVAARGLADSSFPLRLVLDAHTLRDAVDVVEVRDHLDRVVDRGVVPAVATELVGVGEADGRRRPGQLNRVIAERPNAWLELGLAVVVRRVERELVICGLSTEVVCVRERSVVAVVRARGDRRE